MTKALREHSDLKTVENFAFERLKNEGYRILANPGEDQKEILKYQRWKRCRCCAAVSGEEDALSVPGVRSRPSNPRDMHGCAGAHRGRSTKKQRVSQPVQQEVRKLRIQQ